MTQANDSQPKRAVPLGLAIVWNLDDLVSENTLRADVLAARLYWRRVMAGTVYRELLDAGAVADTTSNDPSGNYPVI